MKVFNGKFLWNALILSMGIAIAEPPFLLETDKQSYLQFQPVYLKLSSSNSKNNDMQVRPLEFGDFVLKMEFPDGTRSIYRPMIQACSFSGAPRTKGVEYSTLILNGAELVSSKIGIILCAGISVMPFLS